MWFDSLELGVGMKRFCGHGPKVCIRIIALQPKGRRPEGCLQLFCQGRLTINLVILQVLWVPDADYMHWI